MQHQSQQQQQQQHQQRIMWNMQNQQPLGTSIFKYPYMPHQWENRDIPYIALSVQKLLSSCGRATRRWPMYFPMPSSATSTGQYLLDCYIVLMRVAVVCRVGTSLVQVANNCPRIGAYLRLFHHSPGLDICSKNQPLSFCQNQGQAQRAIIRVFLDPRLLPDSWESDVVPPSWQKFRWDLNIKKFKSTE